MYNHQCILYLWYWIPFNFKVFSSYTWLWYSFHAEKYLQKVHKNHIATVISNKTCTRTQSPPSDTHSTYLKDKQSKMAVRSVMFWSISYRWNSFLLTLLSTSNRVAFTKSRANVYILNWGHTYAIHTTAYTYVLTNTYQFCSLHGMILQPCMKCCLQNTSSK